MPFPLAAPVAAILLVADPAPDGGPVDAATFATQLGQTVGAATECGFDGAEQFVATAELMIRRTAARSDEDEDEMADRFHDAMEDGQASVLDDPATCAQIRPAYEQLTGRAAD